MLPINMGWWGSNTVNSRLFSWYTTHAAPSNRGADWAGIGGIQTHILVESLDFNTHFTVVLTLYNRPSLICLCKIHPYYVHGAAGFLFGARYLHSKGSLRSSSVLQGALQSTRRINRHLTKFDTQLFPFSSSTGLFSSCFFFFSSPPPHLVLCQSTPCCVVSKCKWLMAISSVTWIRPFTAESVPSFPLFPLPSRFSSSLAPISCSEPTLFFFLMFRWHIPALLVRTRISIAYFPLRCFRSLINPKYN